MVREYDRLLRWVLDHQPLTLAVAVGTLVFTVLLYVLIPKGFFPVQDTGFIQGYTQAGPTVSFAEMSRRQEALASAIRSDPDVESLSSFIGVDGTNATLNGGRMLINLKAKGERGDIAATMRRILDAVARGRRHHALSAAGAGSDDRFDGQPRRISIRARGRQYRRPQPVGSAPHGPPVASCRNSQNVSTNFLDRGLSAYVTVDRDTAARFGVTAATIDNALYDAFGQRIISTIFTEVEPIPGDPGGQSRRPEFGRLAVQHLLSRRGRRTGALGGVGACRDKTHADRERPSRPVPGGDGVVRRGARLFARGRGQSGAEGGKGHRPSRQHQHQRSRDRRWLSSPRSATSCC